MGGTQDGLTVQSQKVLHFFFFLFYFCPLCSFYISVCLFAHSGSLKGHGFCSKHWHVNATFAVFSVYKLDTARQSGAYFHLCHHELASVWHEKHSFSIRWWRCLDSRTGGCKNVVPCCHLLSICKNFSSSKENTYRWGITTHTGWKETLWCHRYGPSHYKSFHTGSNKGFNGSRVICHRLSPKLYYWHADIRPGDWID